MLRETELSEFFLGSAAATAAAKRKKTPLSFKKNVGRGGGGVKISNKEGSFWENSKRKGG